MTITGTPYFISFDAAATYYAATEGGIAEGSQAAARKVEAGEIYIGRPATKQGETLSINREEGRYFITTQK
jgi:hypothetical protein